MWDRKELKKKGKANFKKNYWPSVLVALVLTILTAGSAAATNSSSDTSEITNMLTGADTGTLIAILVGVIVGSLLAIVIAVLIDMFVTNPLIVGGQRFFVRNGREEKASLSLLVSAYKDGNFGKIFVTMFLRDLYLFLWSLLFLIPGIVKYYSYRMVPFILADHPEMSGNEVITMSREMMNGNKGRAFVLDLSFIGWEILACITFGLVGIFYVNPYMMATNAELYEALKK